MTNAAAGRKAVVGLNSTDFEGRKLNRKKIVDSVIDARVAVEAV